MPHLRSVISKPSQMWLKDSTFATTPINIYIFLGLQTPIDEKLSDILWTDLIQYLIEAGIDVELLHSCRELVVQGLLLYFVINLSLMISVLVC